MALQGWGAAARYRGYSLTLAGQEAGDRREAACGAAGVVVDIVPIPGGGQLQLLRHDQDFEILIDDEQLMGSWAYRSEQALATLAFDRLGLPADRVLIGGLGMGFTLGATRAACPSTATIIVAELVPEVVAWACGPLAHIFGDAFDDPRVVVEIRDVHDVIVERRSRFDAILLDVDNGPDGFVTAANERLYCNWGLKAAHAALRPGGVLGVWSAYPDRAFSDRLRAAGFEVDAITVESGGRTNDPPHIIWLATRLD